ncbi:MAG: right-handed parallel beta-helix repeat-containing protein [Thermoplasmatales archaeon]|nr:right-handed parallel beta-helix repeat-containing protein [Thermoplasmatales archaeon]
MKRKYVIYGLILVGLVIALSCVKEARADTGNTIEVSQAAQLTTSAYHDRNPSFLKAADGTWWVFFARGRTSPAPSDPDTDKYDICYVKSTDNGTTWSEGCLPSIPDGALGSHGAFTPAALQDSSGKIWVFYAANGVGIYYFISEDNGLTWEGPTAAFTGTTIDNHMDALVDNDGKIWVFYMDYSNKGIHARYYDGVSWSLPVLVGDPLDYTYTPRALQEADGTFRVVYGAGPPLSIYLATSSDGQTWSSTLVIDTPNDDYDPVLVKDGETWRLFFAPYILAQDHQWLMTISSTDLSSWSDPVYVTAGSYGSNKWWDFYPEAVTPSSMVLFFTSMKNGTERGDCNIWMYKPVGWDLSNNHFEAIQPAIDFASAGDTIYVSAGTYVEVGQIVISKNLTIIGENKETTIIKPAQDTGGTGDARGWFLVQDGKEFNLSNVTLDGEGKNVSQAIRSKGSGTIHNNIIKNIGYSQYVGWGIVVMGNYNMVVSNNTLTNIQRIGIMAFGSGVTNAEFTGNTYIGKGEGDWLDYGIEIGGGAKATITGNTITNCKGVASDGSKSAGILVTDYYEPGTEATITGNTLTGNYYGIHVGYLTNDTSVVVANYNSISGNTYGLKQVGAVEVDATYNYWGHATGPYHPTLNPDGQGDNVSDNVDFYPWWETPTGSIPPETTLTIGEPSYEDYWITSSTQITLSATDEGSGVDKTYYRIDTGSWQEYTTPFTITEEGEHTIYYYSIDKSGCEEEEKSKVVNVDDTPPETTLTIGEPSYEDYWITSSTPITLSATDEGSGVYITYYKIDDGDWTEYVEPFTITTEGMHTIYYYSIDNLGNTETEKSIVVYVDDTPPETTLTIGEPSYEDYWITSSTPITLSATDEGSGVYITYYKIDDGDWTEYVEPFTITGEGEHTIYYYSIDNLGNIETEKSKVVNVDDTPPETTLTIGEPSYEDYWITSSTPITLSATDEGSGVYITYYKIDDGDWTEYVEPFTITGEGEHTIYYYSIDNLGNIETEKSKVVNVDDTKPTSNANPISPYWQTTILTITATASDDGCGVGSVELWYRYSEDNSTWGAWTLFGTDNIPPWQWVFNFPAGNGYYQFYTRAKDNLGNYEDAPAIPDTICAFNNEPPVTTCSCLGPLGTNGWYIGPVTIYLYATDPQGVAYTRYRINGGEWQIYTGLIHVSTEGLYTVEYYSVDIPGNEEPVKSCSFGIAYSMPITTCTIDGIMGENGWYVSNVQINLVGVAYICGVKETYYRIDGGAWQNYVGPFTFTSEGTHTIEYYSISNSGIVETPAKITVFKIDKTAPTVKVIYPNGGEVLGGTITIRWTASDNIGVASIDLLYSADAGLTWNLIASNIPNTGSYNWNTAGLPYGSNYMIKIIAKDIAGNKASDTSDGTFTITAPTPPTVSIVKPRNALYIFDREIIPLPMPVIIGGITIEATASSTIGVAKVEFYIDNVLKSTDTSAPYSWTWDERAIGMHEIKVIAYDSSGQTAEDRISVTIINPKPSSLFL